MQLQVNLYLSPWLTTDKLSDSIEENICQGLLDEGHLYEIFQLSVDRYLSDWLTTEDIRDEMVKKLTQKVLTG